MKLDVTVDLNLKIDEAKDKVLKAAREAMLVTVNNIRLDATRTHPYKDRTGTNTRSLEHEASGYGSPKVVDPNKIQGAVYSTSGYGGYLETGTVKMSAFPYLKPAADIEVRKFPEIMKNHLAKMT